MQVARAWRQVQLSAGVESKLEGQVWQPNMSSKQQPNRQDLVLRTAAAEVLAMSCG